MSRGFLKFFRVTCFTRRELKCGWAGGTLGESQFVPMNKMQEQTKKAAPGKGSRTIKKLTRKQITEGLDQFPVEILLSAGPGKKAALTTKQREFARQLALGKTKAQAYRESRDKPPSPATMVAQPYRLAADPRIQAEVTAYQLAIEAEKHRTPAQLKSLLVQQLVQHSLDEEFPPAQRVQCLKLLGSLFEVGAFVERKEITTIKRSEDIRARILSALKDVTDATPIEDGLSLLAEIKADPASQDETKAPQDADPTPTPPPQEGTPEAGQTTHTIPHERMSWELEEELGIGKTPPMRSEG